MAKRDGKQGDYFNQSTTIIYYYVPQNVMVPSCCDLASREVWGVTPHEHIARALGGTGVVLWENSAGINEFNALTEQDHNRKVRGLVGGLLVVVICFGALITHVVNKPAVNYDPIKRVIVK